MEDLTLTDRLQEEVLVVLVGARSLQLKDSVHDGF